MLSHMHNHQLQMLSNHSKLDSKAGIVPKSQVFFLSISCQLFLPIPVFQISQCTESQRFESYQQGS